MNMTFHIVGLIRCRCFHDMSHGGIVERSEKFMRALFDELLK